MEKIVEKTLLYDFYGELLTARQKEIYEEVVFNDMSLSEAAEEYGVSRQGIHDMIRRTDKILEGYEEKLRMVTHFEALKKLVKDIQTEAGGSCDREKILSLSEKILTEI